MVHSPCLDRQPNVRNPEDSHVENHTVDAAGTSQDFPRPW